MKKICEYCNKEFKTPSSKRKFCCQSCATKKQMSNRDMIEKIQSKRMKTMESYGGYKPSEETRLKMSEKMKGRNITWGNKISQSLTGKPHPSNRTNFKHSDETKQIIRQKSIEQMKDPDMIKLISIRTSNAQVGRIHNEETKRKIGLKNRIHHINRIKNILSEGDQISPNWNPKACDYFEEFDRENNTKGQHARNGGEFYIEELGYWVDYINHDLKLIMEYDEKHHFNLDGNLKEKDIIRQKEIQEIFSDYEFKRIKE